MTPAQKKARAVFLRAIEYRKKHPGVTLKQAFAWAKKGTSAVSGKTKVKKKAAVRKKSAVRSSHKDTKSHNVNIRVVSGWEMQSNPIKVYEEHIKRIKYFELQKTKIKLLLLKVKDDYARAQLKHDFAVIQKQLLATKKMATIQKKLI